MTPIHDNTNTQIGAITTTNDGHASNVLAPDGSLTSLSTHPTHEAAETHLRNLLGA